MMILLTHRYLAQITIEASSAFAINSGKLGLLNDNVVAKDANGLPYLPGTSIAGVLRHSISEEFENEIFGSPGTSNTNDGIGSRLIISAGLMVGKEGKVIEGLEPIDFSEAFYSNFNILPLRDHVKISSKGSAVKGAKYDEELVFKGSRFVFELELKGSKSDLGIWNELLDILSSPFFRLGAGSRKGHGEFKVVPTLSNHRVFDLRVESDLLDYLSKSVSLNQRIPKSSVLEINNVGQIPSQWKSYKLNLKAKDFFLFGSGFGDGDVDQITKKEKIISWKDDLPIISNEEFILIPATSIKGALAHRVRYNYSKLIKDFIESPKNEYVPDAGINTDGILEKLQSLIKWDTLNTETSTEVFEKLVKEIEEFDPFESSEWANFENQLMDEKANFMKDQDSQDESNAAIKALFGFSKGSDKEPGDESSHRGNVLISDTYLQFTQVYEKVFNHIKIDRFTGGGIDGALFQEKAYFGKDNSFELEVFVHTAALKDQVIKEAWENTLSDLVTGSIPLGGQVAKGHGFFSGTLNTK